MKHSAVSIQRVSGPAALCTGWPDMALSRDYSGQIKGKCSGRAWLHGLRKKSRQQIPRPSARRKRGFGRLGMTKLIKGLTGTVEAEPTRLEPTRLKKKLAFSPSGNYISSTTDKFLAFRFTGDPRPSGAEC